jgi:hypothetical protein
MRSCWPFAVRLHRGSIRLGFRCAVPSRLLIPRNLVLDVLGRELAKELAMVSMLAQERVLYPAARPAEESVGPSRVLVTDRAYGKESGQDPKLALEQLTVPVRFLWLHA